MKSLLSYRKVQSDPADISITLADRVDARIGRDGGHTALGQVGAVLTGHGTTGQGNWKIGREEEYWKVSKSTFCPF